MMNFIYSLPTFLIACIIISSFLLFAFLLQLFVRRTFPTNALKPVHEVIAAIVGILGVLYSVLVAFILVQAQQRNIDLHYTILTEASLLGDLYRDAAVFPEAHRDRIRNALREYVNYVIHIDSKEFGLRDKKIPIHISTQVVWDAYYNLEPKTDKEKVWYSQSIDKLNGFNDIRVKRLISSEESLGILLWIVLVLGGILSICSIFLFYIENFSIQLILSMIISSSIGFLLFVILIFDNPFWGDRELIYRAFQDLLLLFDKWA